MRAPARAHARAHMYRERASTGADKYGRQFTYDTVSFYIVPLAEYANVV